MKNQKVRIISLILALTMALTLAACGGNTDEPSNSTNPPPSTSAGTTEGLSPKDDTISDSTSSAPKPGDFLYWNLTAAEGPDEQIWGFALCFQGDTTQANPQFGDVAVSIDGARVDTPEYTMESTYYADFDRTDYAVYFTLQPGEMQKKPAQYVLEITCNGVNLRHPTIDWQADGTITISEDSPIPTLNILSEATQSPGASGGDTQLTPGADVQDIPDNGTPPTVEPPLESHAGDKGYFYTTTDNYVVYVTDGSDNSDLSGSGLEAQIYILWCFTAEGFSDSTARKFVFADKDDADAFMAQIDNDDPYIQYIQLDNVVYRYTEIPPADTNKSIIMDDINENQYEYYDSMP